MRRPSHLFPDAMILEDVVEDGGGVDVTAEDGVEGGDGFARSWATRSERMPASRLSRTRSREVWASRSASR